MSKSRLHLRRRKTSKQKTFSVKFRGILLRIKAMDSQSALHKAFRKTSKYHKEKVGLLESGINAVLKFVKKSKKPQTDKQKVILKDSKERKKVLEGSFPLYNEFKLTW